MDSAPVSIDGDGLELGYDFDSPHHRVVVLEPYFDGVGGGDLKMFHAAKVAFLTLFFVLVAGAQQMPVGPYNPQIPVQAGNTAMCPGASGTVTSTANQYSTIGVTSQSGALTCNTPTATQLCALFPFVSSQGGPFWWDFYLVNNGTGAVTVGLGTGVTNAGSAYTGTLTVAAGSVKHFIIVLTQCGTPSVPATPAAQLFSLGTSVF